MIRCREDWNSDTTFPGGSPEPPSSTLDLTVLFSGSPSRTSRVEAPQLPNVAVGPSANVAFRSTLWSSTVVDGDLTLEDGEKTAERIWNVIRAFAVREGLRRADDRLPKRFLTEPIPDGPSQGMLMSEEVLEKMKDEYYEIRGWDKLTGIPTYKRLLELDLPDISEDMRLILEKEKGGCHE